MEDAIAFAIILGAIGLCAVSMVGFAFFVAWWIVR